MLSTVNIQHIETLALRVQAITGITVREQVPDWVLDRANEIVINDLTPEALVTRRRYVRGGSSMQSRERTVPTMRLWNAALCNQPLTTRSWEVQQSRVPCDHA